MTCLRSIASNGASLVVHVMTQAKKTVYDRSPSPQSPLIDSEPFAATVYQPQNGKDQRSNITDGGPQLQSDHNLIHDDQLLTT